ncbi:MAG: PEGA domain-containing protein [candidate division Zixibacteria bacterium]|nr:PEGA domain-containing protein [candidate division Zixibacteria bacterium]
MKTKLLFILFLLLPAGLAGQEITPGLTVNTSPSGANVILDGDISINGLSPIGFPGELNGKYKLTVREAGYETSRQTIYLYPGKLVNLTLSLKQKTRFKATIRSMVIPGWGQMYSGRKGKGFIFSLLAVGAAGYFLITDNDFSEKLDDYERVLSQYNNAGTEVDKATFYSLMSNAKQKAYDAENKRAIAIGSIIGVWGLNIIDALFFFPNQKNNEAINSLSIKPDIDHGGAQFVFSHRF